MFRYLYPQSKVLVVARKNFNIEKRNETLKRITDEDFDAILMAYSCFDMLSLSKKYYKELYEEKLKDSTETYSFDKFEEEFSEEDIKALSTFFETDEGKEPYKEIIDKHPSYKYFLNNDLTLNTLLSSINDLKVIEVSNIDDFNKKIVNKDQILYYMMAEKSIQDAIKSKKSEEYFGFEKIINIDDIDGDFIKEEIVSDNKKINHTLDKIFIRKINKKHYEKKRYFLTFDGSGNGLFDILHKDFETKIFKKNGKYESDISSESKETIMKLIHKKLKIGNSISTQFADYLVRLEAHMLLKNKKSWFVVENNSKLRKCFVPDSEKILNQNAFVEIEEEDYTDIKNFLTKFHALSDNDFNLEEKEKKVVILRFYKEQTQAQVGKILGITQVQVSRIERKVLDNMRRKLSV